MNIFYGTNDKKIDITQICKNNINKLPFTLRNYHFKIEYGTKEYKIDVSNKFINLNKIPSGDINRYNIIKIDPIYGIKKSIFIDDIEYPSEQEIDLNKIKQNTIYIPRGEQNRTTLYTDPNYGLLKKIFIIKDGLLTEYDHNLIIKINTLKMSITTINLNNVLNNIHRQLKINNGSFNEELPEQIIVLDYLNGNEKILEIGGNIGRNSLVISYILNQNLQVKSTNNLIVLECDNDSSNKLNENKNLNNFNFHIENSALSNHKLIQKGWDTIPSNILLPEYNWVNTITLKQLYTKYCINFDTLIIDCEGAFYYILIDYPEILNNVKLIIVENDYKSILQKEYVDNQLIKQNFYLIHKEDAPGIINFYEVWIK